MSSIKFTTCKGWLKFFIPPSPYGKLFKRVGKKRRKKREKERKSGEKKGGEREEK